jgi:hypothetical protein
VHGTYNSTTFGSLSFACTPTNTDKTRKKVAKEALNIFAGSLIKDECEYRNGHGICTPLSVQSGPRCIVLLIDR